MVGFIVTDGNGHMIAAHSAAEEKRVQTNNSTFKPRNGKEANLPSMAEFTERLRQLFPNGSIIANRIKETDVGLPYGTYVHEYLRNCPELERDMEATIVQYRWKSVAPPEVPSVVVPEGLPPQLNEHIQSKIEEGRRRMIALYHATNGQPFRPNNLTSVQLKSGGYRKQTLLMSLRRFSGIGKYVRKTEDLFATYEWLPDFAEEARAAAHLPVERSEPADSDVKLEARIERNQRALALLDAKIQALQARRNDVASQLQADTLAVSERKSAEIIRAIEGLSPDLRAHVLQTLQLQRRS